MLMGDLGQAWKAAVTVHNSLFLVVFSVQLSDHLSDVVFMWLAVEALQLPPMKSNWNFFLSEANLWKTGFVGVITTALSVREVNSEVHFYSEHPSLAFLIDIPLNTASGTWSHINWHTTELLLWIWGLIIQVLRALLLAQGSHCEFWV